MSFQVNTTRGYIESFKNNLDNIENDLKRYYADANKAHEIIENKINEAIKIINESTDKINYDIDTAKNVLDDNNYVLNQLANERDKALKHIEECRSIVAGAEAEREAATRAMSNISKPSSTGNSDVDRMNNEAYARAKNEANRGVSCANANLGNANEALRRANEALRNIESNINYVNGVNKELENIIKQLEANKRSLEKALSNLKDNLRILNESFNSFKNYCSSYISLIDKLKNITDDLKTYINNVINLLNINEEDSVCNVSIDRVSNLVNYINYFQNLINKIRNENDVLINNVMYLNDSFQSELSSSSKTICSDIAAKSNNYVDFLKKTTDKLRLAYNELLKYISVLR